jgi:hypothetical protein
MQIEAETAGLDGGVAFDERLRLLHRARAEDIEAAQFTVSLRLSLGS